MIEINLNALQKGEQQIKVKGTSKRKPHYRTIKTAAQADAEVDEKLVILQAYKEAAARTNDWIAANPDRNQDAGAVNDFTVEEYELINITLRGGDTKELEDPMMNNYISSISSFLHDAPKYEGTVYRGMGFNPDDPHEKVKYDNFMKDVENNNIITLPAFTSTTCDKALAQEFGGEGSALYTARIMLEIKSKRGVALDGVAAFPKEKEVLMDHGSMFKVMGVEERNGINYINLEEL